MNDRRFSDTHNSWLNSTFLVGDAISFAAGKKCDLCVHHLCPMGETFILSIAWKKRSPAGKHLSHCFEILGMVRDYERSECNGAGNHIRVCTREKIYAKKWHCVELRARAHIYKGSKVSSLLHIKNRVSDWEQFIAFTVLFLLEILILHHVVLHLTLSWQFRDIRLTLRQRLCNLV